jgi:uncharacterized protein
MTGRRAIALAALGIGIVCALTMSGSLAGWLLYPAPPVAVPAPPAPLAEVRLPLASGGSASAWTSTREAPAGAPVVLFFHGNGENLETMRRAGLFEDFADLGVAWLAVDYPGYGRSGGRASERGLQETGNAVVAWAAERHPERPVVAAGWSLGAAVAVALAARHPERIGGLIALSPWTSLEATARRHFPGLLVGLLLRERYDSLAEARAVRGPALVIHGDVDGVIPAAQGRELASALPAGTRWVPVPGAGHNDLLNRPEVWREIAGYLRGIQRRPV